MSDSVLVYDPVAPGGNAGLAQRVSLDTLAGRVVGFIDNAKPNFHHLVDELAELLPARYGVARVVKMRKRSASMPAPAEMLRELADTCDVVITGSGD
ncbi:MULTISPECIES: hypothetical protein [unclassified Acidovorax]|jgi:hypothetical protein|uniref:UGSC family (seleno)protein n=1 Tax=Acidovorax sp. T1m TaxID=2006116 RepID=UPI000B3F7C3C|nr:MULTISPECIES: hypothetical protein [unclassified Acidovorax]